MSHISNLLYYDFRVVLTLMKHHMILGLDMII